MGCDIHTYVEIKKYVNNEEKWVSADYYEKNPYYDELDNDEKQFSIVHIFEGRDYGLFSILADVRNDAGNTPICDPKGLPDDCCDEIKEEYEHCSDIDHSHSYFTLKELKDYVNTHKTIKRSGMISESSAFNLDINNIKPDCWCRGTNQSGWVYREWEDEFTGLDEIIKKLTERLLDMLYINDSMVDEFSDKIRLVFWFDN